MKMVDFLLLARSARSLKVSLCFSRDPYVCLQLCSKFGSRAQSTRFASLEGGGTGGGAGSSSSNAGHANSTASAFPPSSCIPFFGWAMYGTYSTA